MLNIKHFLGAVIIKYWYNWLYIIPFKIFENQGSTDIGMFLLLLSAFQIGIPLEIFRSIGKTPVSVDRLNRYFRGSQKLLKHFIRTLRFMSS